MTACLALAVALAVGAGGAAAPDVSSVCPHGCATAGLSGRVLPRPISAWAAAATRGTRASGTLSTYAVPATAKQDPAQAAVVSADRCLYIPPALADRVVFYDSFEGGADRPEINALGTQVIAGDGVAGAGIAGRGQDFSAAQARRVLGLKGLALPLHKPLTAMMWWRIAQPMKRDSGFGLIGMNGRGYISTFYRSGPWCGLKEPKFVVQVWNWPGISNVNDIDMTSTCAEPGVWHHTAVVVSKGTSVRTYLDGALRSDISLKGRTFLPDDIVGTMEFGAAGPAVGMTIDEVLVLDAALDAEAIRDYIAAVRQLAAANFPVVAPPDNQPR